jgi:hypothetical protein
MRNARLGLCAVAFLFLGKVAGAQVDLRVETDSIEIAALTYAKGHLESVPKSIVLDSRVRSGRTFTRGRSNAQSAKLAAAIGASVVDFGCDHSGPSCRRPDADMGFLLQTPIVKGSVVHITVEMHTPTGVGADTFELARAGKGWYVTRIVARRAS